MVLEILEEELTSHIFGMFAHVSNGLFNAVVSLSPGLSITKIVLSPCQTTSDMCLACAGLEEAASGMVMPGYQATEEAVALAMGYIQDRPTQTCQNHVKYTPGCNFKLSEAVQTSCSAPTFFPGNAAAVLGIDICKLKF